MSPAEKYAAEHREESELRELRRIAKKWWKKDRERLLKELSEAAFEAHEEDLKK